MSDPDMLYLASSIILLLAYIALFGVVSHWF